jgi:hypothetical protein
MTHRLDMLEKPKSWTDIPPSSRSSGMRLNYYSMPLSTLTRYVIGPAQRLEAATVDRTCPL